jgi:hypothetical protein
MIPKVIHYCWFGKGQMSELAERCIASWKSVLPDYTLKLWDESTFDVSSNAYVREAYNSKKYAFVTDFVRLYVLYNFGGVYMDTDVEVLQPLDSFLSNEAFSGFENESEVPTGIMASEAGYWAFGELLKQYDNRHFIGHDGIPDLTTNVKVITKFYEELGLKKNNQKQTIAGCLFMPSIVFCPGPEDINNRNVGKIVTIHHKSGSWLPPNLRADRSSTRYKAKVAMKKVLKTFLGMDKYGKMIRAVNRCRKLETYDELNKKNSK